MPKRKKPPLDDKVQYARFLETAEAVQAEDAKERLEKACGKILKPKQKRS